MRLYVHLLRLIVEDERDKRIPEVGVDTTCDITRYVGATRSHPVGEDNWWDQRRSGRRAVPTCRGSVLVAPAAQGGRGSCEYGRTGAPARMAGAQDSGL